MYETFHPDRLTEKIPVGISSCLLGQNVRFNGGHSRSTYCLGPLAEFFDYQAFCPEMAAGFGTPRPTLRLEGDPSAPRLTYSNKPGADETARLVDASKAYIDNMPPVDGYVLMKNSPSCGLSRIKVYQENGHPHMQRVAGLFTQSLQAKYPNLPIEEEGRLHDPNLRENFLLRVFAHHEFRHTVLATPSMKHLLDFHSRYKYIVMAHNQAAYKAIGRLLSGQDERPVNELIDEYLTTFMDAISQPAKRKNHCNVLMHLVGYLKKTVDGGIRNEILDVIEQYRRGEVNLATPVTLLHHYLKLYGSEYVQTQRYFAPYPRVLGIRNTV